MPCRAVPIARVCALLLLLGLTVCGLSGCSGSGLQIQHIPADGFVRTINFQFQAQLHLDETGRCRKMAIQVRPLNKMYAEGAPPPRLQLYDDDCSSPLRFERAQFVSNEGTQVQLYGIEVTRYLGSIKYLENELVGWLWREGVI